MIFVKITIRRYRGGLSVGSLASRAYHRPVHSAWLLNSFFFSIVNWGLMMMVPPRVKFLQQKRDSVSIGCHCCYAVD